VVFDCFGGFACFGGFGGFGGFPQYSEGALHYFL
jgi:hypothetical protein